MRNGANSIYPKSGGRSRRLDSRKPVRTLITRLPDLGFEPFIGHKIANHVMLDDKCNGERTSPRAGSATRVVR